MSILQTRNLTFGGVREGPTSCNSGGGAGWPQGCQVEGELCPLGLARGHQTPLPVMKK